MRKSIQDWQSEGVMALMSGETKPKVTKLTKLEETKLKNSKFKKTKSSKAKAKQAQASLVQAVETKQLSDLVSDMQLKTAILLPQGWQG